MSTFRAAEPHGPLQELFPDIYWIRGSFTMKPMMRIARNMVVVRAGSTLAVINAVRLSESGEEALLRLGTVTHVVRIGAFHGVDDPYYMDRFEATYWAMKDMKIDGGLSPVERLAEDAPLPIPNARLFAFRDARRPEGALLLSTPDGGLLVTCDAVQHHVDMEGNSLLARAALKAMGFMRPANIGPPWRKAMTPEGGSLEPDFRRLLALDFDHLIGAHGAPCRGGAKAALEATVDRVFA